MGHSMSERSPRECAQQDATGSSTPRMQPERRVAGHTLGTESIDEEAAIDREWNGG
jgi:hypothetical protein